LLWLLLSDGTTTLLLNSACCVVAIVVLAVDAAARGTARSDLVEPLVDSGQLVRRQRAHAANVRRRRLGDATADAAVSGRSAVRSSTTGGRGCGRAVRNHLLDGLLQNFVFFNL
jgi:hypothetical protein